MHNKHSFTIKDGVLIGYRGPGGDVTVPDGVTEIGASAFERCASLTGVTLPAGLTAIGASAFDGCANLQSVSLPAGLKTIGSAAFYDCAELTSIALPDGLESLGGVAFLQCSKLARVTAPNALCPVPNNAFWSTAWYKDPANRENGVLYLGDQLVDADKTVSGEYTVKEGTAGISDSAFSSCGRLTGVIIPDSVKRIGEYAFDGLSRLKHVRIPDGVEIIGKDAFYGTKYYRRFTHWKKGALYLGNYLIGAKKKLSGVFTVRPGTKVIADGAFCGSHRYKSGFVHDITNFIVSQGCKKLTGVILPDGLLRIGTRAFVGCEKLEEIRIPDSATSIGEGIFFGCAALGSIAVDEGNPAYHSAGNCLIETASKTLIAGCKNSAIPTDGNVTAIAPYSFAGCTELTEITIPDSITRIGEGAFAGCERLTSVAIPASVTELGRMVFKNCYGLTEATVFARIKTIGDVFAFCRGLDRVTLPDGLKRIGEHTFWGCESLTDVTLPDSVNELLFGTFGFCPALTDITLPAGLKVIEKGAFKNSPNATIHAPAGSYAETYARKKHIRFKAI